MRSTEKLDGQNAFLRCMAEKGISNYLTILKDIQKTTKTYWKWYNENNPAPYSEEEQKRFPYLIAGKTFVECISYHLRKEQTSIISIAQEKIKERLNNDEEKALFFVLDKLGSPHGWRSHMNMDVDMDVKQSISPADKALLELKEELCNRRKHKKLPEDTPTSN